MSRTTRLYVLAATAVFAACSSNPRLESAIKVTVNVDAAAKAQCVRVIVHPQSGADQATAPIARKDVIHVAVYRAEGWSADVSLFARGYANCAAETPVETAIEESAAVASTFPGSGTTEVTLELKPKTPVVDNDGDTHAAGPDDCNDNDPSIYKGAPESCTDTVDKNCSGATGCVDSACTGGCGTNGLGTCESGTCVAQTEAVGCADGQDNDSDGLLDCADPDCTGLSCTDGNGCTGPDVCQTDGGCSGPATQVTCNSPPSTGCFLSNGSCNPADGGCSYPTKTPGTACSDGSACTSGDTCAADGSCTPGTPKVCQSPPGVCFGINGTCNPADAGCNYPVQTGMSCSDNNACTTGESCQADGGCGGVAPKVCNMPDPCHTGTGTCNTSTGDCTYTTNAPNGTNCDDSNACTTVDKCNAGNCIGATPLNCSTPPDICHDAGTCVAATGCTYPAVTCTPNECQTGGSCSTTGGCTFTNKADNTSCANGAGTCQAGQCQLNYQPFGFDSLNFRNDGGTPGAAVVINCSTTLNTGGTTPTLTLCDGGTQALSVITQKDGTTPAALLSTSSFTLSDAGTLTVSGTRPLIIASYGDAYVGGLLDVSATMSASGPGANLACSGSLNGDFSVLTSGGTGAAGGGNASTGGNGGQGNANSNVPSGGATLQNVTETSPLVGGCSGGLGGSTASNGQKPQGGGGGGAVQLSSSTVLTIAGTITAAGGGGQGGTGAAVAVLYGEGGAGGGSAGMIVLEGAGVRVLASARITANGGSGGEGGNGPGGANGFDGNDGSDTVKSTTANGGDNANKGGNGGAGGGSNTLGGATGGNGANDSGGGGGGGGGGGAAGRVKLRGIIGSCRETNHVVSPSNNNGVNGGYFIDGTTATGATCP